MTSLAATRLAQLQVETPCLSDATDHIPNEKWYHSWDGQEKGRGPDKERRRADIL